MEEMPAAAPQATMTVICRRLILSSCPNPLPMAAPIWMIGPSVPADPPDPMVRALATALTTATRGRTSLKQ